MIKKGLFLTFDYELFLGSSSGTPREYLLEPVNQLLRIVSSYPLKMIIFIDTLYLPKLWEMAGMVQKCQSDFVAVCEQLRQLVKAGHDLFRHLHPHWQGAEYLAQRK